MQLNPNADHPLPGLLSAAVPIWIVQIVQRGGPSWDEIQACVRELEPILERADSLLLFKGKETKDGDVKAAFNKLAKGIALLSFMPGGIEIFGSYYNASNFDSFKPKTGMNPNIKVAKPLGFKPKVESAKPLGFKPKVESAKPLGFKPKQAIRTLTPPKISQSIAKVKISPIVLPAQEPPALPPGE